MQYSISNALAPVLTFHLALNVVGTVAFPFGLYHRAPKSAPKSAQQQAAALAHQLGIHSRDFSYGTDGWVSNASLSSALGAKLHDDHVGACGIPWWSLNLTMVMAKELEPAGKPISKSALTDSSKPPDCGRCYSICIGDETSKFRVTCSRYLVVDSLSPHSRERNHGSTHLDETSRAHHIKHEGHIAHWRPVKWEVARGELETESESSVRKNGSEYYAQVPWHSPEILAVTECEGIWDGSLAKGWDGNWNMKLLREGMGLE
ncbi:hypothetical protein B0A49_09966 [Cryomyces minteri]|uniref:Uncharacterized protein n=1 Tax=Cryomyces minteri TaxID=331657 RepID=A0A4U0WRD0_9PEZI|nr:hypothetical protein B0A49_09966 [Cryomyces minteri]